MREVLAYPKRMHIILKNGKEKSREQLSNPGLPGKWP